MSTTTLRPSTRPLLLTALLCACGALAACTNAQLALSEEETADILAALDAQVAAERESGRRMLDDPRPVERQVDDIDVPDVLTLGDALRLSARHNRDLESRREGLVFSALTLRSARRDVGLRLAGAMGFLLADTRDVGQDRSDSLDLSATELLPTGAEVSVSGALDHDHGLSGTPSSATDGSLTARLRQPLLSGFGYESSHESLTDAERQALYDVRDFDLSRQDLALRVQRDFYSLVSQKKVIANREKSLENFEFLKQRSEALFNVDRVNEVDKFRATREYLSAENALIDARQEYESRLDRFKILLGLDTEADLDVADTEPSAPPFDVELGRAIDVALVNRLDLKTVRDQVEDAERRLRISEQALLPSLDLEAVHTLSSRDQRSARDAASLDNRTTTVGLSLELPLDRVRERAAVRRARIDVDRSRRQLALSEDQVIADVRDSLRNLRSSENSLRIQEAIVASQEKNAKVARLRFERGEIGNRDLTEALISLADAQDRLARELANVASARMQLLRDIGVLVIEEDGTWLGFED